MQKFHKQVQVEVRTFVEYLGSGYYSKQNNNVHEVNHRNVNELDIPPYFYGVRFFNLYYISLSEEVTCISDREEETETIFFGGTRFLENGITLIRTRNQNVVSFNPATDHILQ